MEEAIHTQAVKSGRTVAFAQVHRQYPSLCDGMKLKVGEGVRKCENCGWTVRFHEDSMSVKEQSK